MNNQFQLSELVRRVVRQRALSRKTENAYLNHIKHFIEFIGDADLSVKRAANIDRFLKHLGKNCSASTCNQAHSALIFLYREVLEQKLSARFAQIKRLERQVKTPQTFSHTEAKTVLKNLCGANFLAAALMYGAGLRISEVVALRVRDVDFEQFEIKVRSMRTGALNRTTILPASIIVPLKRQMLKVEYQYEDDCLSGFGQTILPKAVGRKYPNVADELAWQYLFPAVKLTPVGDGKSFVRLHLSESTVQKAVADAIEKAHLESYGGCQTLRYSFASRLSEQNCDAHAISRLLGHKNIKTTLNYFETHGKSSVRSPLD